MPAGELPQGVKGSTAEASGASSRVALFLHKPTLAGTALHTEDAMQAVLALALFGYGFVQNLVSSYPILR